MKLSNPLQTIFLLISLLVLATKLGVCLVLDHSEKFKLDSEEQGGAVHIPFAITNGAIIVKADIGGKLVDCRLDTGAAENVWWTKLGLAGKRGKASHFVDGLGFKSSDTQMFLPSLKLNGYQIFDVMGYEMDGSSSDSEEPILLSNSVFSHVVLTIDYSKHELVIHPPNYDFTRETREVSDSIIPFDIADKQKGVTWGVPILRGNIDGSNARLVLDTGWTTEEIGVFRPFFEKLARRKHIDTSIGAMNSVIGTDSVSRTGDLLITLNNTDLAFNQRALVIYPCLTADGIIGTATLQDFQVTIDYPRKRMLFHRYREDSGPNFAKGANTAKDK